MRQVTTRKTGYYESWGEVALLEIYIDRTIVRRMAISKKMYGREQLDSARIATSAILAYKTAVKDSLEPRSDERKREILEEIGRKMEKKYDNNVSD